MKTMIENWQRIEKALMKWKPLGCKTLLNGATVIGHMPSVAPEAWLHSYYMPLTSSAIEEMGHKLGVKLPKDLIEFYLQTNGLNIFSDSLSIWGLRENYERNGESAWQPYDLIPLNLPGERPGDATKGMVFIGSYNWDGSKLYFDGNAPNPSRIFRCSLKSVEPLNYWGDFWTMLQQETERLSSMYNNQGMEIDPNEPTTP